jgi:hypothetical protein
MTDSPAAHVLVPYSRFLECRDRRHRIAAELTRRDQPPTIDADVVPVPAKMVPAPIDAADGSLIR